jgi:murein DD-endopeptidase MepM/ murein hydrolase activator NlpD
VWAAAGGKTTFRGWRGGAGNCVILRHEDGLSTIYMHLSKFRKGHQVGAYVRQKEVIGYVGATGLATGPHLHFGVKKNGGYIDPLKMKMARGAPVARAQRGDFEGKTKGLVAELARVLVDAPPIPAIAVPVPPAAPAPSAD